MARKAVAIKKGKVLDLVPKRIFMSKIPVAATFHPACHLSFHLLLKSIDCKKVHKKIAFHLVGRVAFLGASLISLAEAVGRVAFGSFAAFGYLATLGCWTKAKSFGERQFAIALQAGQVSKMCLIGVFSVRRAISSLFSTRILLRMKELRLEEEELLFQDKVFWQDRIVLEPQGELTPEMRSWRVRQGAERIAGKLEKLFSRAQLKAKEEPDKEFRYQKAPKDFKAHTENVAGYEVGVCHFIGRRPEMEDEHLATSFELEILGKKYPVQLFGVFDGHGGKGAAIYVKENLKERLQETLTHFCTKGLSDEAIWNGLKITFARLKADFKGGISGTTATVAMILDGKLWTANVGDSRTILDNGIQLSEDAKPDDPIYKKGIERRGGRVLVDPQGVPRVNGNLAVARAIGDRHVGAMSGRPKITAYPLSNILEKTHLILACDGVYDVASTKQVAGAVKNNSELSVEELAKNIVYSAYESGSEDNVSTLVVKLSPC